MRRSRSEEKDMDVIALVAFGVLVVAWAVLPLRERSTEQAVELKKAA